MWLQVKDGKIIATNQDRPIVFGHPAFSATDDNEMIEREAENQWLQTFREVEDQNKAEDLLPSEAFERWNGPEDSDEELKAGLYRVEAVAKLVTQLKTVSGRWVDTYGFVPEIEEENPMCEYRQVIRIKN